MSYSCQIRLCSARSSTLSRLPILLVLWWLAGAVLASPAAAATALTLMWDPSQGSTIAGYIVFVGTAPDAYTQSHDVGNVTWFTFPDATPGQRYCFAVAAYAPGPIVGARSSAVCGFSDRPPVLKHPGDLTSRAGAYVALQLEGFDPDGRAVSYAATGLPPGLALTPSTGFIAGTPDTPGTYPVRAAVSDGILSSTQQFSWTILPPLVSGPESPSEPEPGPEPEPPAADGGESPPAVAAPGDEAPLRDDEGVPESNDEAAPGTGAGHAEPRTALPRAGTRRAPLLITRVERGPGASRAAPQVMIAGTTDPAARIVEVTWSSGHRSGRASGTTSWSVRIPLMHGENAITISARGAGGELYTQILVVRR